MTLPPMASATVSRAGGSLGQRADFAGVGQAAERTEGAQQWLVCGRSSGSVRSAARARKVLGWPKICKLAHAFLSEYSYNRLKLAQFLGQLGVVLTQGKAQSPSAADTPADMVAHLYGLTRHGHHGVVKLVQDVREPGVRSHCRFRKRGTEYVSESCIK